MGDWVLPSVGDSPAGWKVILADAPRWPIRVLLFESTSPPLMFLGIVE